MWKFSCPICSFFSARTAATRWYQNLIFCCCFGCTYLLFMITVPLEHHIRIPPFIINSHTFLGYAAISERILHVAAKHNTAPLDSRTKDRTEHRGMFDATLLNHVVAWSKSLQLTSVASCYTEYRSGYLIARPRIHPRYNLPPRTCIFNQRPVTDLWSSLHFTSLHFAALFPNVPSRCVPRPISHTQTLDFQLGDSTLGVDGIKQYTIRISSMEQVEAESVASNTLVSKLILELSLTWGLDSKHIVPVYSMKAYGGVEVHLHSLITLSLDWLSAHSGRFTSDAVWWTVESFGCLGEGAILCPLRDSKHDPRL